MIIFKYFSKHSNWVLLFYLLGKCTAGSANLLLWTVSAEMYPTNLRGQSLGFFTTIAKIFALFAPFVAPLANYWKPLPMLVLGIPSFLAAGLTMFLPETKSVELPQTIKDSDVQFENIIK